MCSCYKVFGHMVSNCKAKSSWKPVEKGVVQLESSKGKESVHIDRPFVCENVLLGPNPLSSNCRPSKEGASNDGGLLFGKLNGLLRPPLCENPTDVELVTVVVAESSQVSHYLDHQTEGAVETIEETMLVGRMRRLMDGLRGGVAADCTPPTIDGSNAETLILQPSKKKPKLQNWQEQRRIDRERKQQQEDEQTLAKMEYAIPQSNIGFKMLKQMGYNPGSALGKDGCGLAEPVGLEIRRQKSQWRSRRDLQDILMKLRDEHGYCLFCGYQEFKISVPQLRTKIKDWKVTTTVSKKTRLEATDKDRTTPDEDS
ncbi:hypothetical protein HHK36_017402 [Tetracentron sinense]|uniref:G-patch domain-containing protein n=1 Tax=Tetracentron sinense TaxID=13715 RepID=A0A834YZX4_TETSI|nr:hypothetical protein HHK36_017402 [Tetracentron sinense]